MKKTKIVKTKTMQYEDVAVYVVMWANEPIKVRATRKESIRARKDLGAHGLFDLRDLRIVKYTPDSTIRTRIS
jgi:hypothetical protein